MFLCNSPHERRLIPRCAGVDVGTFCKQLFHDGGIPDTGRNHQDRFTEQKLRVRIRSGRK
jgi:hypothetical protein